MFFSDLKKIFFNKNDNVFFQADVEEIASIVWYTFRTT